MPWSKLFPGTRTILSTSRARSLRTSDLWLVDLATAVYTYGPYRNQAVQSAGQQENWNRQNQFKPRFVVTHRRCPVWIGAALLLESRLISLYPVQTMVLYVYGLLHVTMDRILSHFYHDNDYDNDDDDDDDS
jgi:hypothetical protein